MGFVLVDDDFLREDDVAHSSIRKPKKAFGDDIEDDGDEIVGVEVGAGGGSVVNATNALFDKNRAGGSTVVAQENQMKRQEFDKRVKELTQQNNAAAASIDFDLGGDDDDEGKPEAEAQRLSQTLPAQRRKNQSAAQPYVRERAKRALRSAHFFSSPVATCLTLFLRSLCSHRYDTPMRPDMAATISGVQTTTPAIEAAEAIGLPTEASARAAEADPLDSINIVDVETMLDDCCKIFKGTKILPEGLKKALTTADDANEGYLSKRKVRERDRERDQDYSSVARARANPAIPSSPPPCPATTT
jgi:hypothetical protein